MANAVDRRVADAPFNITLNLSAIADSLLYIPSLVSRFFDNSEPSKVTIELSTTIPFLAEPTPHPHVGAKRIYYPIEGSSSTSQFFMSSYTVVLLLMGFFIYRLQNVVLPLPGAQHTQARRRQRDLRAAVKNIYGHFLPLDLSKTTTRLAVHVPTLYFLVRSLVLWVCIVLQCSDLYPTSPRYKWMRSLGQWSEQQDMQTVCWSTFCSVCAAFCVEAMVKGFERLLGHGLVINPTPNSSPFNLIGYSFLLHVYSSPFVHEHRSFSNLPSRPDKHTCMSIAIPLVELIMFHVLSIVKPMSNHRFWPTAVSSFLSIAVFNLTNLAYLGYHVTFSDTLKQLIDPTDVKPYPIANFAPNVFETLLIFTTASTVLLNAVTQLLLLGKIDKPLVGLGMVYSGRDDGWSFHIPYEEDFGVFLLRVGTASMDATRLRGWGNEVGRISAPDVNTTPKRYGSLLLARDGVVQMIPGIDDVDGGSKHTLKGFYNEIRNVNAATDSAANNDPFRYFINYRWFTELWNFLQAVYEVVVGVLLVGRRPWHSEDTLMESREEMPKTDGNDGLAQDENAQHIYRRFLAGDTMSDDEGEGDEWRPGLEADDVVEDVDDDDGSPRDVEGPAEALELFTDIQSHQPSETTAPVLLAHMTEAGSPPLTRRRYGERYNTDVNVAHHLNLGVVSPRELPDERRRNCVICTAEVREIICWPCRCLSMCDSCRETMAERSSASKHRCPCCRQRVEGYSKIFIP